MRDAHARGGMVLLQARWAMSLMLGPMTRTEIRRALGNGDESEPPPALGVGESEETTIEEQQES